MTMMFIILSINHTEAVVLVLNITIAFAFAIFLYGESTSTSSRNFKQLYIKKIPKRVVKLGRDSKIKNLH